ncbi:MAG: methylmalonyl-CoA mutase [Euryarchaeota archaeon]|nr:methylmalonyl-CoA mutase [Euryarchaeota archaeon]
MAKENPGEFPFKRGLYKEMYRERTWTMRQYAGFTTAEQTNQRFLKLLEDGVTGLSIAFDLPTQIGYDSDHSMAEGEVGKVGVPISILDDMEKLFKNIPLDSISTSMTINATAPILLAFYIVAAEKRGIKPGQLKGTIQNDILKEYSARGTYIFPPKDSMRLATDVMAFCDAHVPKWNTISISGYHIREAGSTAVQELAFTFSNAIAYVQSAIDNDLDPNKFGSRLSFFFNAHNGFIEEIAKFRAARKLWATIMRERFSVTNEKALYCRFHTQTAGSTLTANQIDNNVIRTTIQALSAVLGGTQSLHTNSRDEALALPSEDAAELALRTQQIIALESGITAYPDPFGGSYLIEELTERFYNEAMSIIKQVDDLGGAIEAIESGFIENEITRSAYEYQKQIEEKDKYVVGVNIHEKEESLEQDIHSIDPKLVSDQINNLRILKKKRDNLKVQDTLGELQKIAKNKDNIMPSIINCVKNNCTLGEISDTLRLVFGEY